MHTPPRTGRGRRDLGENRPSLLANRRLKRRASLSAYGTSPLGRGFVNVPGRVPYRATSLGSGRYSPPHVWVSRSPRMARHVGVRRAFCQRLRRPERLTTTCWRSSSRKSSDQDHPRLGRGAVLKHSATRSGACASVRFLLISSVAWLRAEACTASASWTHCLS